MNNRTKYLIILALVTVGLYFLDNYVSKNTNSNSIDVVAGGDAFYANWYPNSTTGLIIDKKHYSFSYNEAAEQAEWVAYWLSKEQIVNNDYERPYFQQDPMVSSGSAHWRNYKNSGYDRGHLCPAADMEFNYSAFKDTFFTSNISPQLNEFNSGVWNYLEQRTRNWAKQNNGVFVITGGVLKDPLTTIGDESVVVPSAFYKIILSTYHDEFRVVAFLIPHNKNSKHYAEYATNVRTIEAATGIDFFTTLSKSEQDQLESRIDRLYFNLD